MKPNFGVPYGFKEPNTKNTINPKTIDDERSQRDALRRLRAKIKVSDNETYLRALQNGDISVAFGGSDDVGAIGDLYSIGIIYFYVLEEMTEDRKNKLTSEKDTRIKNGTLLAY